MRGRGRGTEEVWIATIVGTLGHRALIPGVLESEERVIATIGSHEVGLLAQGRRRQSRAGRVEQNRRAALRGIVFEHGRGDTASRRVVESGSANRRRTRGTR